MSSLPLSVLTHPLPARCTVVPGLREPVLWTRWGHDSRATASAFSIATDLTRDLVGGEILMLYDVDRYAVQTIG